jgi:predicted cupin superfamily sugar epimerase
MIQKFHLQIIFLYKNHLMHDASFYIKTLQLQPHPEGGYYKETYRSTELIAANALPSGFKGARHFSTAIYYLLQQGNFSAFHKIQSDECWHFYAGDTLLIHVLHNNGYYECIRLGHHIDKRDMLQFIVPANTWFAAEPATSSVFTLTGCTVAPGFDFADFEMAAKESLLKDFSQHAHIITRLCRC